MKAYEYVKFILDEVVSIALLILLSPIFLIIFAAIKLGSKGPVFFRQDRLGRNGKPFSILKFRTMVPNAKPIMNADGSTYTGSDDPRVTKIGRVLRKTSLDELPQLINVVRGEMSMVGPRPDLASQLELYDDFAKRKLAGRPGMTGYAMIMGRNNITWRRRIELDVYYLDHLSLWMDLKIFFLTLPIMITGRGVNTAPEGTGGPSSAN